MIRVKPSFVLKMLSVWYYGENCSLNTLDCICVLLYTCDSTNYHNIMNGDYSDCR